MDADSFQRSFDLASLRERLHLIHTYNLSINFRTSQGETILHTAVLMKDLQVLDWLYQTKGVDWDAVNLDGVNALNLSARANSEKIIHNLLVAGANIFATNERNETVLHYASTLPVFSVIFDYLADPKEYERQRETRQQPSVMTSFRKVCNIFGTRKQDVTLGQVLDFIMQRDESGKTFLDNIKSPVIFEALFAIPLVRKAIEASENDFMHSLVSSEGLLSATTAKVLSCLAKYRLPIEDSGPKHYCSLLHKHFESKYSHIIAFLLSTGEDPMQRCHLGFTAYHHAALSGQRHYFKMFPCTDPVVLGECYVLAHVGSAKGNSMCDLLKTWLINNGIDLSLPEVLLYAIKYRATDLVQHLISKHQFPGELVPNVLKFAVEVDNLQLVALVNCKMDSAPAEPLSLGGLSVALNEGSFVNAHDVVYVKEIKAIGGASSSDQAEFDAAEGKTIVKVAKSWNKADFEESLDEADVACSEQCGAKMQNV